MAQYWTDLQRDAPVPDFAEVALHLLDLGLGECRQYVRYLQQTRFFVRRPPQILLVFSHEQCGSGEAYSET